MSSSETELNVEAELITDGYLKQQIRTIQSMIRDNFDIVLIVDGSEGSGKSMFSFQMAKMVDPTFNIDRIVFSAKQFEEAVVKCSPGNAIVLDESMNCFFSRTSMSGTNVGGVKLLAMCRFRRLFMILVIPSIFSLDSYASLHRSSALIHVYSMPKDNPEDGKTRGFFRWYDRTQKKRLILLGKKSQEYKVARPSFFGRFANKSVIDMKAYEEKKYKSLVEINEDDKPESKLTLLYKKKYLNTIRYLFKNHNPYTNRDDFIKWTKKTIDIDVTIHDLVMKSLNTEMKDDP